MGERSTLGQKPGYNGLCSYTQQITSCFGLDGKARVRRKEGGVLQGAEISLGHIWRHWCVRCVCVCVCVVQFFFFLAKGQKLCFPVHVCVAFVSACVGWRMVLGGSVALQQNRMSSVTLRSMCPHVWVEGSPSLRLSHMLTHARHEDKGMFVKRLCFESN